MCCKLSVMFKKLGASSQTFNQGGFSGPFGGGGFGGSAAQAGASSQSFNQGGFGGGFGGSGKTFDVALCEFLFSHRQKVHRKRVF